MKRIIFSSLIISALFISISVTGANKGDTIHRYAFIVGSNNGGPDRVELRYAISDAASVLNVLKRMGGVAKQNSLLLIEPDRRNFLYEMNKFKKRISTAKKKYKRVEMIFYYSGHSDEEGILLGRNKVYYSEIKKSIKEMPADVHIAILDSCSSGVFTRLKGGKMKSPFMVDDSYNMKGYAFMTSSSSNEASQESDRIKGSFFTHYLISGLRGAADMTQDGRITLNEAYQFAYNETLARTEKTISGPQHPNYFIKMSGTGDVIMTDIRKSSAGLVLHKTVYGKFFIRDTEDILVAELKKAYGRTVDMGLEKGSYKITNNRDGKTYEADIKIPYGRRVTLYNRNFNSVNKEYTRSRGDVTPDKENKKHRNLLVDDIKSLTHGGYGAPVVHFTKIGNQYSLLNGARGGWIINHKFVLGIGGYGLSAPQTKVEEYTGYQDPENKKLALGYGGVLIEYFIYPNKLFTISLSSIIGAGGVGSYEPGNDINELEENSMENGDPFFIAEPEINIMINITSFFRFGIGSSYRYSLGADSKLLNDKHIRGFSISAVFAFGAF